MLAVLKLAAQLDLPEAGLSEFQRALAGVKDWPALLNAAEQNGLSPLIYRHIETHRLQVPEDSLRVLRALAVRHRHAHRARMETLEAVVEALDQADVPVVLLKGAALVQTLYPSPELRPMSDLDLLVPPKLAERAQRTLRGLGFYAPLVQRARAYQHHHLPIAHKQIAGMTMQIEIHRRLLPPDARASKDFYSLSRPLVPIALGGQTVHALGHADQLWHLCQHLLLPGEQLRLNAVLDVYAYAERYREEFDWAALPRTHPFIYNALRCLHFHLPMPEALASLVPPPAVAAPSGVGEILPPLSVIEQREVTRLGQARALFLCSNWWLHAFYGWPPERDLAPVRYLFHPWRVILWLAQRGLASTASAYHQWREKRARQTGDLLS